MRPSQCDVCGRDITGDSGLVTFLPRDSDREWRERAARSIVAGHPPDTAWLCTEHVRAGRLLATEFTIDRALDWLRSPTATIPRDSAPLPSGTSGGVEIAVLVSELAQSLPAIAADAGIAGATVETEEKRDWMAMDRAFPPHCPFVDTIIHSIQSGSATVRLTWERSHWNPDEVATTHAVLEVASDDGRQWRVLAYPRNGSTRVRAEDVTVRGTPAPAAKAVLSALILIA